MCTIIYFLYYYRLLHKVKRFFSQAKSEEIETVVSTALECGYRHIDTATNYRNEDAIGKALKKWFEKGGDRKDLFITTKVFCKNIIQHAK